MAFISSVIEIDSSWNSESRLIYQLRHIVHEEAVAHFIVDSFAVTVTAAFLICRFHRYRAVVLNFPRAEIL